MLDSHHDLAIPPETGFIIPLIHLWGTSARMRRSFFNTLTRFPFDAPAWQDFGITRQAFWTELENIDPFSIPAGLRCFYRMYAMRFNKFRWGDKTPSYGLHMPTIEQLLPEARFIHVIRDGRDTALSLRDLWFSPGNDIETLAKCWSRDVSKIRMQGRKCRHYLEVRFEELVLNPSVVLQQVCEFCGLDYDPHMESFFVRAPQRLQEHQARVKSDGSALVTHEQRLMQLRLTMSPPDPSRVFAWKRVMGRKERQQFEKIAGGLLVDLGYEITTH
jgi:Sulfotransferase family